MTRPWRSNPLRKFRAPAQGTLLYLAALIGVDMIEPRDAFNQAFVDNVRPPAWTDPEPAPRYNLVVIGAGTAGLVTAAGAAGLGAKVALVERDYFGGDCLNFGCVPSKAVLRAGRAVADVRNAGQFGVRVEGSIHADFGALMERMRRLRRDQRQRFGAAISRSRRRCLSRRRQVHSPDTLEVNGKTLRFRRAVIATEAGRRGRRSPASMKRVSSRTKRSSI